MNNIENDNTPQQIDYNLHGIVGIRLLNATPGDIATVTRQLGLIQSPLIGEPDIIIRFVEWLSTSSPVRYLDIDKTAFTDDAFLILNKRNGKHVKARVDFDQIGKQCEIVCETGLSEVPLLIPILNLTALGNGVIPLHASAFTYNGTGVLTTGWTKGGKTESLLAFTAMGAEYIGDEWIYISGDGRYMYGIPHFIRVWDWHLQDLPQYRALIGWNGRARLGIVKTLQLIIRLTDRAMPEGMKCRFPASMINRMVPLLKRKLYVDMTPQKLFGNELGKLSGSLEKVFFVVSHQTSDVEVRPIDPREIARRMVFSVRHELMYFMSYYRMFRFAFPKLRNELIEQAEELWLGGLMRALRDKDAYVVYHPYPVQIPALFDAISPLISR